MEIEKVDENFKKSDFLEEDIQWFDVSKWQTGLFGVYYDESERRFRRIPAVKSSRVSVMVDYLATHVSGGRICFRTDSPTVAIKAKEPYCGIMQNMPVFGTYGFSVYEGTAYRGTIEPKKIVLPSQTQIEFPEQLSVPKESGVVDLLGEKPLGQGKTHEVTVYFPLYNGVTQLLIGIRKGCSLQEINPYGEKSVVFYGSSITQGACASHPGNDYVGALSRTLQADVVNLGFAGNAKGEKEMAEILAEYNPSVFVLDYDANAPTAEHLQNTYFKLYETIREKRPKTPMLFISRPGNLHKEAEERRKIIKATYEYAKAKGERVAYLDGGEIFGEAGMDVCNVDTCHPNDTGFYFMTKAVAPILRELLL